MKRKNNLTVFGMALYGGIIFAVFLAYGLHSDAVELPAQEAPPVTVSGLTRQREVIRAETLIYTTP